MATKTTVDIDTARRVAEWLRGLDRIESAVPVRVRLPDHKKCDWVGALYCTLEPFQPEERMVTAGAVEAGEIRRSYRLYLVGKRPAGRNTSLTIGLSRPHNIFLYDLPADRRQPLEACYTPSNEWYIMFWHEGGAEHLKHAPFGVSFAIGLHQQMNCGPYKDWKIDTNEPHIYDRHEMTVEYLE